MDAGPAGSAAVPVDSGGRDGAFSPSALVRYLFRNSLIVLLLAAFLLGGALYAFRLVPFPYRSTAIVIVDPREQKISPTQEVLPGIGTNTAALESVVQIVQSGGFLAELLKRMDVSADPELANARTLDPRSQLQEFRDRLTVERRGATYLVDISYTSKDPERAALYANRVAEAFVANESDARTGAASNAADSLSGRLGDLRQTLRLSEEAVARFKVSSGMVDVDANSTLGQREIAELSEQLTLARSATDAARARAQNLASATAGGDAQSSELSLLRREQSDLARSLAELSQTYGARHPRIVDIRSKLSAIDTQIERERSLVGLSLKRQLDVAQAQQADLERRLSQLVGRAGRTDEAQVQLADLERQAASDRAIYEQYLTQYKAVDEQRLMPFEDVRVVSAAMPPLKSTRPSLVLVGVVAGMVSLGIAVLLVLVPGVIRGRFSRA
ncbi:GumC family protein [Aureimonas sp. AU12]|uniref:GumC family protein n=1 Tax=Aureimonas sp. AU12 TaxID=1638161 RepID=UPI00178CA65E|nr:GumC family protein [Aureimonas sp. AU12]